MASANNDEGKELPEDDSQNSKPEKEVRVDELKELVNKLVKDSPPPPKE